MQLTKMRKLELAEAVRFLWLKTGCIIAMFLYFGDVHAQIGVSAPPMLGPGLVTCTNMELMKQVPCPDSQLFFHEGGALVQMAFNAKDFKQLDSLYELWCSGNDRFPDGRWKLSQYGDALAENFRSWNKWAKDLEAIKLWKNLNPKSEAALYTEAVYWRSNAWKARGWGLASTVSKEGWELFRERMNKSKEILGAMRASPSQCPGPYPLMLTVLTELGAPEDQLVAVFNEGISHFPEYHDIYFSMATHYQPKWGGSVEKYDAFAKRAAEQTKKFEGMGMYARLYWLVDNASGIPFDERSQRPPEWKKLHTGYEDLLKKYPSSIHNIGKYAGVVCRTKESKLYRELRAKIDGYEQSADMFDPVDVCDRRHRWDSPSN